MRPEIEIKKLAARHNDHDVNVSFANPHPHRNEGDAKILYSYGHMLLGKSIRKGSIGQFFLEICTLTS